MTNWATGDAPFKYTPFRAREQKSNSRMIHVSLHIYANNDQRDISQEYITPTTSTGCRYSVSLWLCGCSIRKGDQMEKSIPSKRAENGTFRRKEKLEKRNFTPPKMK